MRIEGEMRAMLFDLDGTVADTHGLIMQSYHFAIQEHIGRPGLKEIWEARIGLPLEEILVATYLHYGFPEPAAEHLEAVKQTYRDYMRRNDDSIQAFPDVLAVLAELRARGIKLGVVTTKHQKMAMRHLEKIGALAYFEDSAIICGDMSPRYKPAPEPFYMALRALDVDPQHAAMAGDSRQDILGAKAAGLFAIAACWGTDNRADLLATAPDRIAELPVELLHFM